MIAIYGLRPPVSSIGRGFFRIPRGAAGVGRFIVSLLGTDATGRGTYVYGWVSTYGSWEWRVNANIYVF